MKIVTKCFVKILPEYCDNRFYNIEEEYMCIGIIGVSGDKILIIDNQDRISDIPLKYVIMTNQYIHSNEIKVISVELKHKEYRKYLIALHTNKEYYTINEVFNIIGYIGDKLIIQDKDFNTFSIYPSRLLFKRFILKE